MVKEFTIEGVKLAIDTVKTESFYLTQNTIIDSCDCSDCLYYFENFTKVPLQIFSIISEMGADLQKNLDSEPTGVWCIRYPDEQFLHCEQMYYVVGNFVEIDKSEVKYEKEELGYIIRASFFRGAQSNLFMHVWLSIDKA